MAPTEKFLAFLDTETGGLIPGKSPVLEIATILTDLEGNDIGTFESKILLRPGDVVDPAAAKINGYDASVWQKEAKPFAEYMAWLHGLIPFGSVAIPVGHNVGFDRDMIDLGYYKPAQRFCPLSYHKIDTVALAAAMRLAGLIQCENLKLATVAAALKIEMGAAHRAASDCVAARKVFLRAVQCMRAGAAVPV